MISLKGETDVGDVRARLRIFNGTNKLYPDNSVSGKISGKGQFKYFWFLSTGAKDSKATGAYW